MSETGKSQCDNCSKVWNDEELIVPIPDFFERVAPGEVVPSGECPACGALCHPYVEWTADRDQLVGRLVEDCHNDTDFLRDLCQTYAERLTNAEMRDHLGRGEEEEDSADGNT